MCFGSLPVLTAAGRASPAAPSAAALLQARARERTAHHREFIATSGSLTTALFNCAASGEAMRGRARRLPPTGGGHPRRRHGRENGCPPFQASIVLVTRCRRGAGPQ